MSPELIHQSPRAATLISRSCFAGTFRVRPLLSSATLSSHPRYISSTAPRHEYTPGNPSTGKAGTPQGTPQDLTHQQVLETLRDSLRKSQKSDVLSRMLQEAKDEPAMKDPQRQREIDLLGQERFEQLERHRERENEMESRKRRVAEMLQRVRETKITERVGLKYANQSLQDAARSTKFFKKPRRQFQMRILPELKEEFDIRREGRDYTVGKERVDAMDWELWCLHGYPMIKV